MATEYFGSAWLYTASPEPILLRTLIINNVVYGKVERCINAFLVTNFGVVKQYATKN